MFVNFNLNQVKHSNKCDHKIVEIISVEQYKLYILSNGRIFRWALWFFLIVESKVKKGNENECMDIVESAFALGKRQLRRGQGNGRR